jgi:SAM-dependent methyltransferase
MHSSVMAWVTEQVEAYDLAHRSTLELGSLNVNGSVRPLFTGPYIGIDMQAGQGVDRVMSASALDYTDASFDVVVSTEMLEHDPAPWLTLAQAGRVLRTGGHLLLTMRGNGFAEHAHPSDYWRFMPCSAALLTELAACDLIESMVDPEAPGLFVHGVRR